MVALVAAVALLACADGAPVFVAGPEVEANPGAGLTAWVRATLDRAAALEVEVTGPHGTVRFDAPAAPTHRVLLLGLHAEVPHEIVVRAVDPAGGGVAEEARVYAPPPLPDGLPPWTADAVDPGRMEPGATLLALGRTLVAVDPEGHAVWTLAVPGAPHEAALLPGGTLLVLSDRTTVTEYDLAGAAVRRWVAARTVAPADGAIPVDVEALHHDVAVLPDGHLVSLSIERRWIEDYPASETDPAAPPRPAWVAGDVVVEFDPEGAVVGRWPLLDRLDPRRVGYDAVVGGFWEDFPPWRGDEVKDWSHGNAVSYDAATDTVIVGLRHQDAVVGLSRSTGEVRWIVAPEANWPEALRDRVLRPEDPGAVPYHPHGAKGTASGTVMLFDNGNNRASPFEPKVPPEENFSRALEVAIDAGAGTFREVWSFGEALVPPHFSGSLGDADPLPVTGNVLVTFGNLADPNLGGVRILEVTREGEPVWELIVPDPDATTFRSQRVRGMLPGL